MMMILPDGDVAENFSVRKLAPFLNSSSVLRERCGLVGSRRSSGTMFRKDFPGGFLNIAGANSPNALRMQSVRLIFADEVDGFRMSSGKDGDPLMLAFRRTQTFANRKLFVSSTPLDRGTSKIDDYFSQGDQRYYHVKLPCCAHLQKLVWENVKWRPGHPETAEYACNGCGTLVAPAQLKLALTNPLNRWIAEKPFNGIASFHIWQIYSLFSSLEEIVREYEKAKGKPMEEKVFSNTFLGESYEDVGAATTTAEHIYTSRVAFPRHVVPNGACQVVAGVDVQNYGIEVLIVAYGPNKSTWMLDHHVLEGSPSSPAIWARLENLLLRRYPQQSHPHIQRTIEGVAIDSGAWTQQVYEFAVRAHLLGRPWYAIKGEDGEKMVAWQSSKVKLKGGAKVHLVGIDTLKTELYARWVSSDPEGNFIRVRKDDEVFTLEKCEQMVSERVRTVIDGKGFTKREWIKSPGVRNEQLDMMVYAEAVSRHLAIDYEGRMRAMAASRTASTADLANLFA